MGWPMEETQKEADDIQEGWKWLVRGSCSLGGNHIMDFHSAAFQGAESHWCESSFCRTSTQTLWTQQSTIWKHQARTVVLKDEHPSCGIIRMTDGLMAEITLTNIAGLERVELAVLSRSKGRREIAEVEQSFRVPPQVTPSALYNMDDAGGFDNYILRTPPQAWRGLTGRAKITGCAPKCCTGILLAIDFDDKRWSKRIS